MQSYPDEIKRTALNLAKVSKELKDLRDDLSREKARVQIEILTARDDGGKLRYSNDTARDAALTLSLADDIDYQRLKGLLDEMENSRAELDAELDRLRGMFKLHLLDRQDTIAARLSTVPVLT